MPGPQHLGTLNGLLSGAGATFADVVKHNVYLTGDGDSAAVAQEIRDLEQFFAGLEGRR